MLGKIRATKKTRKISQFLKTHKKHILPKRRGADFAVWKISKNDTIWYMRSSLCIVQHFHLPSFLVGDGHCQDAVWACCLYAPLPANPVEIDIKSH